MAVVSPHIAIYEVLGSAATPSEHEGWQQLKVTMRRSSVLKGNPPQEHLIEFNHRFVGDPERVFPARDTRILIFFRVVYDERFQTMENRSAQATHLVRLDKIGQGIVDRAEPPIAVDFRVLSDPDSILNMVREMISKLPTQGVGDCEHVLFVDFVPETTQAFRELWSGSGVELYTTFQPRHRALLLGIASEETGRARVSAARAISACMPEIDVKPILESMLEDPDGDEWWTGDTLFPARQFAYDRLVALGAPPSQRPEGYLDDDSIPRYSEEITAMGFDLIGRFWARSFGASCTGDCIEMCEPAGEYPDSLMKLGVEGRIALGLELDPDGRVTDVGTPWVRVDSPRPGDGPGVLEAARHWLFRPVTVGGEPRAAVAAIPIDTEGAEKLLVLPEGRSPRYVTAGKEYDRPPEPKERYFPSGWHLKRGGRCEVEFELSRGGSVWAVRVVEERDIVASSLNPENESQSFKYALLDAMKGWEFQPPTVDGVPTPARVRIPFEVPTVRFVVGSPIRFYPGERLNPDGPLELLSDHIPEELDAAGAWEFSVLVRIDREGRVVEARLPTMGMMRPLVEYARSAVRGMRFPPFGEGAPDQCTYDWSFDYELPTYEPRRGLFPDH